MIVYGLANCDTCRKARKALPGAAFVDVRADGLPAAVVDAALDRFGAALVNTRSTTWRALSPDERDRPHSALLSDHPTLMKRPLIVQDDGRMQLGWTAEVRGALGIG